VACKAEANLAKKVAAASVVLPAVIAHPAFALVRNPVSVGSFFAPCINCALEKADPKVRWSDFYESCERREIERSDGGAEISERRGHLNIKLYYNCLLSSPILFCLPQLLLAGRLAPQW